ncbi:nuclear transport factor 2 family protein [Patulibacter minatonensis]|uniref:nuclear transport factor 2 family protein n=1 Tax=Patulibacter minatonensis TaxID=298163 RepID=UPI00047A1BEE|nr:nuclear transport factor 2 family protein [Patulibacter minatonensis]
MPASSENQLIEAYIAARAAGDVAGIVACVTDDLRWERNGFPVADGCDAFRTRLTAELPTGRARSSVDRLFAGPGCGFTVGGGRLRSPDGGPPRPFRRVEAFVIDAGRISVLRTTDSAA